VEDLQWRILYGAIAVNAIVSIINHGICNECSISFRNEIYLLFFYCNRLIPWFQVLQGLFGRFDEILFCLFVVLNIPGVNTHCLSPANLMIFEQYQCSFFYTLINF